MLTAERYSVEIVNGDKDFYGTQLLKSNFYRDNCGFSKNCVTLRNGVKMPLLGLGTTHSGGYNHESVLFALKDCHYRMIDTAKRYGVEEQLGLAIRDSNVPRADIFLTSKLWPVDFGENARLACHLSCRRLGTEYLGRSKNTISFTLTDLYLIHFPEVPRWFENPSQIKEDTWRQMEQLYDEGTVKAIGVSNYQEADLEEILDIAGVKPHVNQFEFHPCYNPTSLRHFCDNHGITFTGYCPLAKGQILNEPVICAIAQKHYRTPAQICIRWSIENGVAAIPKSRKFDRIAENRNVFDFHLDNEDMQLLSTLHNDNRKVIKLDNLQEKFTLPDGYKLEQSK